MTDHTHAAPAALGWHDSHNASAVLLADDGRILYAAAEERFTKNKLQKGYPAHAIHSIEAHHGPIKTSVAYTDLAPTDKIARNADLLFSSWRHNRNTEKSSAALVRSTTARILKRNLTGYESRGTTNKLKTDTLVEHHTAHAASAYHCSGFDTATILTIDGVGDCLSGTIFEGHDGRMKLVRKFFYNDLTVGADYETMTALLGFNPDRHCGKVTGLAAYGQHNEACISAVEYFFKQSWLRKNMNWFDRMHGDTETETLAELRAHRESTFGNFSREDLAYAIQYLAETRICDLIKQHIPNITGSNIALAGGVFANVRINQKIKQLGFANIFIQPAMDDAGLALGAALHHLAQSAPLPPYRLPHMFTGPGYTDEHVQDALDRASVKYQRCGDTPDAVAQMLADGKVVARFDGRMEFGPRALGNRSILYDTRDPSVNAWLNKHLNRTDFMPFAPATLIEHVDRCYTGYEGCEHTAEFMTITFDCTKYMQRTSPAVVHVDGTARAQFVTEQSNPGFHAILNAYEKRTGIPSLVNTSFNMHESPIVNTPEDAVQTFLEGNLDALAIGPYIALREHQSNLRHSETHQPVATV